MSLLWRKFTCLINAATEGNGNIGCNKISMINPQLTMDDSLQLPLHNAALDGAEQQ